MEARAGPRPRAATSRRLPGSSRGADSDSSGGRGEDGTARKSSQPPASARHRTSGGSHSTSRPSGWTPHVQPQKLKHRRTNPGLASLASAVLALAACSGSTAPAPTPALTVSPPGASAIATATIAPSTSPLPALPLLWKCTAPTSSQPSFQPLAVDPRNGDVWATVPFDNLFWICDHEGNYLESWGKAGSGPGQFDLNDHLQNPDGFGAIAFAPDGSFFVGDVGNHRIEKFDLKRKFVKQWGSFGQGDGQFAQLVSVATNGKTVLVGDGDRVGIQAFDLDGMYLR